MATATQDRVRIELDVLIVLCVKDMGLARRSIIEAEAERCVLLRITIDREIGQRLVGIGRLVYLHMGHTHYLL